MELPGLIVTIFAVIFFGFIFFQAGRLINNWVKKRTGSKNSMEDDTFNRMAQAFIQFRNETNRRLENIETVISSEDVKHRKLNDPGYEQIEIDEPDTRKENREQVSKLTNNLRTE